jgi:hypothetical protein
VGFFFSSPEKKEETIESFYEQSVIPTRIAGLFGVQGTNHGNFTSFHQLINPGIRVTYACFTHVDRSITA